MDEPRLIAMAGPRRGEVISLSEGDLSVGRGSSNGLSLKSESVSRHHCVIKQHGGETRIIDLESLNGTFVNGVPVKERLLGHGDQIAIGDSLFLLLVEESEADSLQAPAPSTTAIASPSEAVSPITSNPVELAEETGPGPTVKFRMQDAVYLRPEELLKVSPTARAGRELDLLLRIADTLSSLESLETLQQRLLDLFFELVPADRGAILLTDENSDDIVSMFGRDKLAGPGRPVQVSQSIVRLVLAKGAGIVGSDIFQREDLAADAGGNGAPVQSVLAAPLVAFQKVRGVIYLDTSDPNVQFDENHLRLFSAIGGMAAMALENAQTVALLENENRRLQAEIDIEHNMIGESSQMLRVYEFIAKVAPTDSTVLITGESGTGKELVARGVHANSSRASSPFVAINCAALTESLLESELFGHEKGAFTGAITQKKGKLEIAHRGTVFLDEIGELAPQLQAKLLRVSQEHEFERVGGTRPIQVDIRLIAATNRDLAKAIKDGTFREDLYFRLNVVSIKAPPLRTRREDIPLLANYFLAKYTTKTKRHIRGISPRARACLTRYDWPGNVRELENAIERAVVLGSSELILPEDLPEPLLEGASSEVGDSHTRYHEALNQTKKRLILEAYEQAGGSYTEAAKRLGVHPNYLHRLIRNLNLKEDLRKGASGR